MLRRMGSRLFGDRLFDRMLDLAYLDPARPIEWISAGFLLNFAVAFLVVPEITERDSYAAFAWLPQSAWAAVCLAGLAVQLTAIFTRGAWASSLRYFAMAGSLGFFATVATAFWVAGVATTANGAYLVLCAATFFASLYLLHEALKDG